MISVVVENTFTLAVPVRYFHGIFFLFVVVLYAVTASYFAGVMVRLMLTLTPVVCVLASIAFSVTLDNYIHPDVMPVDEGEEQEKESEEEQKKQTK